MELNFKHGDCPYRVKIKQCMERHLKRHENGLPIILPIENKQRCIFEECEFKAPSLRSINLLRHLESQHSDVRPVCKECGKELSSYKELLSHINAKHENLVSCELCGKQMYIGNLKRHVETMHHKRYIDCEKCKESYPYYSKHLHKCYKKEESPKEKEICTLCGKMVVNLNGHIRQVHNAEEKMIQCPICGKSIRESNHKSHMISHEEKKACPICGINVRKIEEHIKHVHTPDEEKKYHCQDCGKGFMRDSCLQKHRINVHLKTYPYQCRYGCDAKYNDTSNRNSHEKKKHGGLFQKSNV